MDSSPPSSHRNVFPNSDGTTSPLTWKHDDNNFGQIFNTICFTQRGDEMEIDRI